MIATLYTRYRGETIQIGVADDGAEPGGEALIASSLRALRPGRLTPLPGTLDSAGMMVSFRAANAGFPVGWLLSLDAATSDGLPSGMYLLDLKITDTTGMVTITEPAMVLLAEPATL